MVLPVSPNPISLGQIQTEFGGSNPISISEYYNGGPYVTHTVTAIAPNVPSSGPIKFSDFYGAAKLFDVDFAISRSSSNINSFYFSSALGTVTASLSGSTQDQSTTITLKFVKGVSYQITANVSKVRLSGNTIELEDIPDDQDPDNDYNDLRATPSQGTISQVGSNFYYLLT
jgi:hypothetical protein